MLQASNENFLKKRIELEVSYGKRVSCAGTDQLAKELIEYLIDLKNIQVNLDFCLNLCAICEDQWTIGDFAKESLLLIPKPRNNPSDVPKIRITIPRVVCLSCSESLSNDDGGERIETSVICTVADAWRAMLGKSTKVKKIASSSLTDSTSNSFKHTAELHVNVAGSQQFPSVTSPVPWDCDIPDSLHRISQQQNGESSKRERESGTASPTSDNSSSSGGESFEYMVDQKGFIVCTQLVKTGRADLAGLKAGDIFTQFGNMTKENFDGLKSVANIVRRSANKTFQAVVLRQVNKGKKSKKQGSTFRKVRLNLTPLYCHDIDGGGVLGAVINTWPIPVSAGVQE